MASEVVDLFTELAALPSPPGEERAVADVVIGYLRDLGLSVDEDGAGPKVGSNIGNVFCRLEATDGGNPIFLCAHLDTVPPEGAIEPVIDLLPEQKEIEDLGGTMRLGAQAVELVDGTRAHDAYGEPVVHERHRHRYEVNNHYRPALVNGGLVVSGTFQEGRLVEIVELPDHPWFVASQFHPEFKSRPTRPAPLFRDFVGAALARSRERSAVGAASA